LTITHTGNKPDLQNNSTIFTFNIQISMPTDANLDDIIHNLQEKFREVCKIQNENISETHSIQSSQATTCSFDINDGDINEEMYSLVNESDAYQRESLRVGCFDQQNSHNI
jgi:hypothetical protein